MNIKIISEKPNPLFNRKEIQLSAESEVTPSYVDLTKLLIEKFSSSAEKIKIKEILGKFGSKEFNLRVFIYDSKEDKEAVEKKSKRDVGDEPAEPEAAAPLGVLQDKELGGKEPKPAKEVKEEKVEEVKNG